MSAEQRSGLRLAFGNDTVSGEQLVRAVDLGNVQRLEPQYRAALMARHVKPGRAALVIAADKIADGRTHCAAPSSRATATMMAHSMRLRNRSQPCLYTPRTEPVAW